MFKNEINIESLRKALVAWTLGLDGNNYATIGVLEEIPWTDEMSEVISWDEIHDRIDNAIGSRFIFDMDSFCSSLFNATTEAEKLYTWSFRRAVEIGRVYDNIIEELNERSEIYTIKPGTKFICMNKNSAFYLHTLEVKSHTNNKRVHVFDCVTETEAYYSDGIGKKYHKIFN